MQPSPTFSTNIAWLHIGRISTPTITGSNFLAPAGYNIIGNGLNFYSAVMSKYDYTADMNTGCGQRH